MKPLDSSKGCNPISSNCVIWQGPDIACINLCKGDNVSNVVYKLALELCTIVDQLNIENFDLSCQYIDGFSDAENFKELLQLLIDKVCELAGADTGETNTARGIDTMVDIAEYFYYKNPEGDTMTQLSVINYVRAIGNTINGLVATINTINNINRNFEIRITALEDAPAPEYTLPTITSVYVDPGINKTIPLILEGLEAAFANLIEGTGDKVTLVANMYKACTIGNLPRLSGTGKMNSISGWTNNPVNIGESIGNLWLTVCDMRAAMVTILQSCCNTDQISIIIDAYLDGDNLVISYIGTIGSVLVDRSIGSTISINNGQQIVNNIFVKNLYDTSASTTIALNSTIDKTEAISIKLTLRLDNPDTLAAYDVEVQGLVLGTNLCPTFIMVPSYNSFTYSFTWVSGIATGTLTLYHGVVPVSSKVVSLVPGTITGSFTGLTDGTTYSLVLNVNGGECDGQEIITATYACIAPTYTPGSFTIDTDTPEGDTVGYDSGDENYIVTWNAAYLIAHP